ncbi:flagellar motility protein MotE (MotC chaperone) [Hydrogenispora ethanolica]|jgi:flagellar motility protein MotE (MotC chaperone)|uniref:Flagellar motility protein MotE (MotC chaperone) n=1 Tax=Hydrogenispora ethanolica TaxID=1082276 RepID=A0A4R1RK49_HYDET|nr:hypothetical protein [Hydrogenispora ethanolica]TCL66544.1 flagellar motility protein MotE (MotC chaperone) [Hydrogenispora ethanolica]
MVRFFIGLVVVPALLAAGLGGLWILNQFGVVPYQQVVLQTVGGIAGIKDLADTYELGKKRSAILKSREQELRQRQQHLQTQTARLDDERSIFKTTRDKWEKAHPEATAEASPAGSAKDSQNIQADPKGKEFLVTIGGMKPQKAAEVIQKLPEETVYMILDGLEARRVAKIMENLPADYLAKLAQERLDKHGKP